ncbi:related to E3 SUMO-protein ligase MMS21 [Zygosaccharomyces bailii ISA1307]|nr:related to E3 SUMO-protein ligase MMS21 [Zygosaccharomyces bailii ISA1307]
MIRNAPLHLRCRQFHSLRVVDLNPVYQDAKKELIQTLWQIVDTANSQELGDLIKSICESYDELQKCEVDSLRLESAVEQGKQRYKQISDTFPPLNLENWDQYARDRAPSLRDYIHGVEEVAKPPQITEQDRLLRALPYIWQDPQCMLPDDEGTEEGVQIEGGRLELICPITCRPFQQPMVSKKCGHVFEKEGITNYFDGHSSRDCPQGACVQKLALRDFVPDDIMKLRCLIQGKRTQNEDETPLDVL